MTSVPSLLAVWSARLATAAAVTATVGLPLATALLLGLVEGITEFLPVSSTGHLAVTARLLGTDTDPVRQAAVDSYLIVIQAGAIMAVLGLYLGHIRRMVAGALGRDPVGRRMLVTVGIAFIPAAVVGVLVGEMIKGRLFALGPIAVAWIVGGIAILVVERLAPDVAGHGVDEVTPRQGWWVGAAQVLALWPGTSRSLVTILAGRATGLSKVAAVEFSFILGVVTLGAATVYEGVQNGEAIITELGFAPVAVGFVAAAVSAALAVKWLVSYVSRHTLAVFGWYRIGIGLATLAWLAAS